MEDAEQLNSFLVDVFGRINKIEERAMAGGLGSAVSITEIHIIEKIGDREPVRMSEVARSIGVTLATLTVACDKLVAKGLVRRVRSQEDRRVVNIMLTDKGRAAYEYHKDFHERMITRKQPWREKPMDNLIFCLNATVPIFAIIVLGRWLRSKNFFTKQTLTDIDRLSFKVLLPILLFRDIAQGRITEQFDPVFFFFCAGATTVYFFAVWIGASLFLKDKSMVGAFTQGAFRGSQAILGVAFVQNLYGNAGLVPLMIVASVPLYNIFSVLVLTVTAPDAQQADHRGLVGKTLRGIITNPIILGIFAGLPFSLLAIDFPPMLDKGLSMLGNCATPVALLSIGAGFEGAKAIKKLGPTCAAVFIKLVLLSAIFLPMGVALGFREQTLVAIVILCGAPSTASGYVMAKNMGGDHVLSSSIIVLSTALSAVTLTLTLFILRSMALI